MSTNIYVSHSFSGNSEAFQELVLDTRLYFHLHVWVFPGLLLDEAAKPLGGSYRLKQLEGVSVLKEDSFIQPVPIYFIF